VNFACSWIKRGEALAPKTRSEDAGRRADRLDDLAEQRAIRVHHREVEIRVIERVEETGAD